MLYIILAVLAGFSIILSRIFNSNLSLEIGIYQGTFMNYVCGLTTALILFLLVPAQSINARIPFWAFLGGVFGVIVIALSSYITPRLSNFNITLLIFIGQLITAAAIDVVIGNPISLPRIAGGILIIIGLCIIIYIDLDEKKRTAAA